MHLCAFGCVRWQSEDRGDSPARLRQPWRQRRLPEGPALAIQDGHVQKPRGEEDERDRRGRGRGRAHTTTGYTVVVAEEPTLGVTLRSEGKL